ncbi:hypothetical protein BGZ65_007914 [Modicella reniformis]|uniref:Uncharacterized protein n=1 Tax=Modicella reniformis TaxID=1440133 RepID=A0A9P6SUX3_9FUNG|nr:hypothetical protein BGZ65_007914 [Modicella reniformis]
MQQVEYVADSHSQQGFPRQLREGSIHGASDAPLIMSPVQKQMLSSKRMRPPLAEISVCNTSSPLPATAAALSSSTIQHPSHSQACKTPHSMSSLHSKTNMNTNSIDQSNPTSTASSNHSRTIEAATREPPQLHDHSNFFSSGAISAQPLRSTEQQRRLPHFYSAPILVPNLSSAETHNHHQHHHSLENQGQNSMSPASTVATLATTDSESRKLAINRAASRSHLTRDAKTLRTRIRRLWQDPRQTEQTRARHGPKNQYMLLEESLIGILQIVPPIIENAKESSAALDLPHSARLPVESALHRPVVSYPISVNTAEFSANSTTALPSSPPTENAASPVSPVSKSNGSTPATPAHSRARTTSSTSASTISATRYQIATSILQPMEPCLTDIAQPAIRSPTNFSLLGEPALSTIIATAATPSGTGLLNMTSLDQRLGESNEILISKLLSLSNTFTGAIRSLCEQQNEKVLRFDDDMILELLTRWEQEEPEEQDAEPDNTSTASLVTLGATNALERYQITVGRVWEETEVILSSVRKIRDIVEYGRVQHSSDFDDGEDSEEDAVERDEEVKRNLYSTLLFHANGLITVLGEFLECVSGILRLVASIKTQRKSMENEQQNDGPATELNNQVVQPPAEFLANGPRPRPVKHLNPFLMRKLKHKTAFKSIADKVRRSLSDFAKRSTNSLLTIFPPLGDGTNEGFNWDSYSDYEYESEGLAPTEMGSSIFGEEANVRTLSPPDSPKFIPENYQRHHRRLSSGNSSGLPEYWPGSIRLGLSDDCQSPTNPASPNTIATPLVSTFGTQVASSSRNMTLERTPDAAPIEAEPYSSPFSPTRSNYKEKRPSSLFRKSSQNSTFSGISISAPISATSRPFSAYSSGSETQTPSRNNYKARPPKPPAELPPMPLSPVHSYFKADEIMQETARLKAGSVNSMNTYLATRSISPQQGIPLTLDSPFARQTSIRMGNDRNRYSIRMPADDIPSLIHLATTRSSPTAFWRRRSYSDALEKSCQTLQRESFHSGASETTMQPTPLTSEFAQNFRESSIRLTSFEFVLWNIVLLETTVNEAIWQPQTLEPTDFEYSKGIVGHAQPAFKHFISQKPTLHLPGIDQ